jgi:hypothetical protein
MSKPLSPQAQAVVDAWLSSEKGARMLGDTCCLAAALRAAADQVVPDSSPLDRAYWSPFAAQIRAEWLAIAAELEAGG